MRTTYRGNFNPTTLERTNEREIETTATQHPSSSLRLRLRRLDLLHEVQGTPTLQPQDLVRAHSVLGRDLDHLSRLLLGHSKRDHRIDVSLNELSDSNGLDVVSSRDLEVVGLVSEPEGENSLFLLSAGRTR